MLFTTRYRHLLPQISEVWVEAEIISLTGDVRKPDSEDLNILPKVDTWEANATGSLAFHTFFDFVDCNRHLSPRISVSDTKTMGLDGDWMS